MRAGALKVRVTTSSRSDLRSTVVRFFPEVGSLSPITSIDLSLLFQFIDNIIQLAEAYGPGGTVPDHRPPGRAQRHLRVDDSALPASASRPPASHFESF